MEHNTNKEKWIDEVLGSTQGMRRAQPKDGLYERIIALSGPHHGEEVLLKERQTLVMRMPSVRWAAAAILLLALNVTSVIYFNSHNKPTVTASAENSLVSQIQSETTYNY